MSFDFPFVRLFGVRSFCYYPYLQDATFPEVAIISRLHLTIQVGEYRESEITPSLVSQEKPQVLGMTYSKSQLPTSDTLAASDTAASVQILRETCLKQKPPDESKNALSESTKMTQ